ncbi:glycerophosphoryl diester phosphodiesterase membrane domain-containing protein [Kitasatospora phosalacinea]|uniref:Glycerophosphoryl diester phosphodiesterase membrane domain-containing protein n=1 Tax=Kitasatospora phosalacinea TaxID=2065 RepID=A0A9W6UNU5_9ACTN|nr:glycerophosphoryl diester phosphodiesterase membrane domain-containing protein [Kitasatospora phosalacinea]GLW54673.1 hypothetical protein Kpho01_26840 [Kitasatospora phosalacinea]
MSGDGGGPGQQQHDGQQHGGQPYGPGAQGPYGAPGGGPGHWPGYGPAYGQPGWNTGGGWGQGPWGVAPVAPKPGVLPLRPLGFGEMFSSVFDTVRRYTSALYLPLVVVAGILAVPMLTVCVLLSGPFADALEAFPADPADATGAQLWDVVRPALVIGGMYLLAVMVQYVIAGPLATVVLRAATLGRKLTAGQAWREARPRLRTTTAVTGLLFGGVLLAYLLVLVAVLLLDLVDGGLAALAMVLLFGALVVGAVYVTVRLAPQVPVVVLEESGPKTAIRRAWQLNKGNWWRSLGLTALISIVGGFAAGIISSPLRIVMAVALPVDTTDYAGTVLDGQLTHGTMTLVLLLGMGIGLFTSVATGPLVPLANGVLYIDRRIRNERLDIALAEAAGIQLAESYGYPQPAPVPAQAAPVQPAPPVQPVQPAPPAPPVDERPEGS